MGVLTEKCAAPDDESACEKRDRCEWLVTDDSGECVMATTPPRRRPAATKATATRPAASGTRRSQEQCEDQGHGCSWRETDDPSDCVVTTATLEPGCCAGDSDGGVYTSQTGEVVKGDEAELEAEPASSILRTSCMLCIS